MQKLLAVLVIAGCASAAQPGVSSTVASEADVIAESDVRRILTTLAADSMEGRRTGTPGASKAASFIAEEMKTLGLEPGGDSGSYLQKVPFAAIPSGGPRPRLQLLDSMRALDVVPEGARRIGYNVIGIIRGSDSVLRNRVVVMAAHYDHLGIGIPVDGDSIYNGADDNASGVTTVLQVARALSKGRPPARTILFMATTGEEQGILGTKWYVAHPRFPLSQVVAEIEVEMAGRPHSVSGEMGRLWMTGYDRSTMGNMFSEAGLPVRPDPYPQLRFFERSDNIVFARKGIPAHTLSSYNLHEDYHKPSDDVGRIDFAHLAAVSRAAAAAVRLLANGPPPKWNPGGQPVAR